MLVVVRSSQHSLSLCRFSTSHTSLFTIHNCTCTSLHMLRGHSPLRLAPRSYASGALTAEEWTRQSIRFLVAFLAVSPASDLCSCRFRFGCFTSLLHNPSRSLHSLLSSAAPQPRKYGSLALGSSFSLGYGQVASLHSQLLQAAFLLVSKSLSQLAPLTFLTTTRPSL